MSFDSKQFVKDVADSTPPAEAFGRLHIGQSYKVFNGKGVAPTEVERAEYDKADPRSRAIEVSFEVEQTEINPRIKWIYHHRVGLASKDWRKIVAPSIVQAFGSLDNLKEGAYVQVVDVPQLNDEDFNTIKFVKVFDSKGSCFRAWAEKSREQQTQPKANVQVPAEILQIAKTVWEALSRNEESFTHAVTTDASLAPYADALLQAVKG